MHRATFYAEEIQRTSDRMADNIVYRLRTRIDPAPWHNNGAHFRKLRHCPQVPEMKRSFADQ